MDDSRKYLDPEVLAKLSGLDLKARLIVEGFVAGSHKSPERGFSVEFAEHREYAPGDDLRYVDWKVFGRSDRYFLKQYEEETNFACTILLDTSESMEYRSPRAPVTKLEYARYIAAALAWLVIRQQDAAGLATFDRSVSNFVEASTQPSHLKQLLHVMEHSPASGETALGPIFHELAERLRKRGLVVVVSDLFDDAESLLAGLRHFQYRRHDVSVLQIIDPAEEEFPFEEPTLFRGLEGYPDQMAEPRSLRGAYQREFAEFLQAIRGGCRDLHIEHLVVRTNEPLDAALRSFLRARNRMRRR